MTIRLGRMGYTAGNAPLVSIHTDRPKGVVNRADPASPLDNVTRANSEKVFIPEVPGKRPQKRKPVGRVKPVTSSSVAEHVALVQALRAEGQSYRWIAKKVGVDPSTVSGWARGLGISPEFLAKLRKLA